MLPKKKRITKEIFQIIMKKGKAFHGSLFLFRYIPSKIPQYSFVVPKKIAKNTVERNKFRRLGYNTLIKYELKPKTGIFFYKKEALKATKEEIEKDVLCILNKVI
jgi:ribonuclease P protein component